MPDETGKPRASVLIATDDHPPPLDQFFDRLFHQTVSPGDYEVILVDVSQGEDYPQAIAQAGTTKDPRLSFRFIDLGRNSRAAAYNRALKACVGDLIIFFGDDYLAPRTLVESHLRFHGRHPEENAVGIGSAILTGSLRENHFAVWLEASGELYGCPFSDDMTKVPEHFFYVGNSSVKRPFLEKVGHFDERFQYHSWDDYELGVRLRREGMMAYFIPDAKAEHLHDLSLEERCRVMEQAGHNARAFETKYPGSHNWQRRLKAPVWGHRLAALQWRSLHALSRSEKHLIRFYRSRLNDSFGRGYRSADPGQVPVAIRDASPGASDPAPLVSVVMSTYNGAAYLAEQLDSILAQSHRTLEIRIRDDASTDTTPDILLDYASRDSRITVHRSEVNRGLVANLEILMGEARGEFIAPADQDDVWRPDKIETLLDRIGPHSGIYSASRLIDDKGRGLGCTLLQALNKRQAVSGSDPLSLFWGNTVSGHALLFKRSLVPRLIPFDPHVLYDQQIGIKALADGGLAYCDAPLVDHRIHDGNQTNLIAHRQVRRNVRAGFVKARAARIRRRRKSRWDLFHMLRFYQAGSLLASLTENDIRAMERSARDYGRSFFDVTLFRIIMRQTLLFNGTIGRFKQAVRYAKGERWLKLGYRMMRPFRARPS